MKTKVSYKTIHGLTVSKKITAKEIAKHVLDTDYYELYHVLFHLNEVVENYFGLECEIINGQFFKPNLEFNGDNLYEFCHEIEVRLEAEKCGF
jgi:hypothetical protein